MSRHTVKPSEDGGYDIVDSVTGKAVGHKETISQAQAFARGINYGDAKAKPEEKDEED
jgi:hypothetical protein